MTSVEASPHISQNVRALKSHVQGIESGGAAAKAILSALLDADLESLGKINDLLVSPHSEIAFSVANECNQLVKTLQIEGLHFCLSSVSGGKDKARNSLTIQMFEAEEQSGKPWFYELHVNGFHCWGQEVTVKNWAVKTVSPENRRAEATAQEAVAAIQKKAIACVRASFLRELEA